MRMCALSPKQDFCLLGVTEVSPRLSYKAHCSLGMPSGQGAGQMSYVPFGAPLCTAYMHRAPHGPPLLKKDKFLPSCSAHERGPPQSDQGLTWCCLITEHVTLNHENFLVLFEKMSRTRTALCLLSDLELALYCQELLTEQLEQFVRQLPHVPRRHRARYVQNLRRLERFLVRVNAHVDRLNPISDILQ